MEEDRAVADLGPDIPTDLDSEEVADEKKPKRRFIGRRAADAKAAAQSQENGSGIEDSGAVQGAVRSPDSSIPHSLTAICSRSTPPPSACLEQRS